MSYKIFGVVAVISFVIMYVVMFFNVDEASHIYLSLNRLYMALLMVTGMSVVMMLAMGKMYPNKKKNVMIIATNLIVFVVVVFFLRNQTFISDRQYMKAMIPHHSSAILNSKHANITDREVKKLSEEIIASQEREIAEMKAILDRMKK